jgi:hypothetical protein
MNDYCTSLINQIRSNRKWSEKIFRLIIFNWNYPGKSKINSSIIQIFNIKWNTVCSVLKKINKNENYFVIRQKSENTIDSISLLLRFV